MFFKFHYQLLLVDINLNCRLADYCQRDAVLMEISYQKIAEIHQLSAKYRLLELHGYQKYLVTFAILFLIKLTYCLDYLICSLIKILNLKFYYKIFLKFCYNLTELTFTVCKRRNNFHSDIHFTESRNFSHSIVVTQQTSTKRCVDSKRHCSSVRMNQFTFYIYA